MAEGAPPQTPDLAVRAFIGLFVLGAVLHGFDVMKDGMKAAATWWAIGGGLALFDWYWVKIKGWFGPRFAAKANDVATDFRWWAGALIAVFLISGAFDAIQKVIEERRWPFSTHAAAPSDATVWEDRDRYKQELDSKTNDLEGVKRQLAIVQHTPASSADTPTWLRLRFDGKGNPAEVASTNVHWSSLSVPELPEFELDIGETIGSPFRTVTMTTLLFLSFDVPIRPGTPSLEPSTSLPQWQAITRASDRNMILWFHGQILNRSLDISIK
jgi:hypothetical protein